MDDNVVQRVFQEGGRDFYQQPSTSSSSSSSSIIQSLPLHVSFDRGYYLLVKSIQELREKKEGRVTVGIGGPSGSGKTSLAEKVASVIGCIVVSMENYRVGVDDGNDLHSIDFATLVQNLEDLISDKDIVTPVFDFQEKKHVASKAIESSSGVVIVDGTYALHARLRSLLDIRVAVVGGVHFSLLSKVQYDIGDSCSLDYLIDSIFPLFRKQIEPDIHHAQIRINNSFVSSFREPIYKLKCKSESPNGHSAFNLHGKEVIMDNFIEMYLRPPSASEEARINDWIKVRQSGIRYYLSLGDQRIVDKNYIIRPKAEFEHLEFPSASLISTALVIAPKSPNIFFRSSSVVDSDRFFTKTLVNFTLSNAISLSCFRRKGPTYTCLSFSSIPLSFSIAFLGSFLTIILHKPIPFHLQKHASNLRCHLRLQLFHKWIQIFTQHRQSFTQDRSASWWQTCRRCSRAAGATASSTYAATEKFGMGPVDWPKTTIHTQTLNLKHLGCKIGKICGGDEDDRDGGVWEDNSERRGSGGGLE
ncbi:hypothetical protein TEA_006930 [Camellia sinensis var. sinensis]|uniref:Phosphoribulokinase/uridine kinase domain-containing protein n=1 Tax=Camellia sinensis var. sinensis TaxID=542762 RepID=A0A4V3WKA5_CAMSN|nr:hypothetical protein TEA_006930 [Camellia sinensis var. sinensis]